MFNKFKIKDIIDESKKLSGIYNGEIVDIADPGYKENGLPLGRVRVSIPGLTEGIVKELLPWYSSKQNFNSSPNSQATIPPIGSQVVVEFPTNDIYNGLVSYVIISSPPTS